jgi:DNA-binding HxlR family transcriptional regulator
MERSTGPDLEWCPLDAALDLLGRPWLPVTIREFLAGPREFVALREATGSPSPSTFTRRLRLLEQEMIVSREVVSTTPPKVRYALTPKGRGLGRALDELASWAEQWLGKPPPGGGSVSSACELHVLERT